jgi:NADPH-dependent 2,4-dienoyl-CoA reductase/sulfur reductase-like enzyme
MSQHDPTSTDVLIVGAGPVGLSLAIELGGRGLRCILIEQHDRVGAQPRAKTTNALDEPYATLGCGGTDPPSLSAAAGFSAQRDLRHAP